MDEIVGKWVQAEGQAYEGLWFDFKPDGSFTAEYQAMGIVSSGTYQTDGDAIVIDQVKHNLGLVGTFKGLFKIEGDRLEMALSSGAGQKPPEDLSEARIYIKDSTMAGE
jgi:hypothetical protein